MKLFKERPSTKYYIQISDMLGETFILPYYFATIEQARSFIIKEYYSSEYHTITYTDRGNKFYDNYNKYEIKSLNKYKYRGVKLK